MGEKARRRALKISDGTKNHHALRISMLGCLSDCVKLENGGGGGTRASCEGGKQEVGKRAKGGKFSRSNTQQAVTSVYKNNSLYHSLSRH